MEEDVGIDAHDRSEGSKCGIEQPPVCVPPAWYISGTRSLVASDGYSYEQYLLRDITKLHKSGLAAISLVSDIVPRFSQYKKTQYALKAGLVMDISLKLLKLSQHMSQIDDRGSA